MLLEPHVDREAFHPGAELVGLAQMSKSPPRLQENLLR
jgi:hypothetical protein